MLRAGAMSITAFAHHHVPAAAPLKRLRMPAKKKEKNPALEWVSLADSGGAASKLEKEWTHQELRDVDKKRKTLLELARSTSAMDTLFKIWTLPRTVLPRLAMKPLIYIILASFACGAVLARTGIMSDDNLAEAEQLEDSGGTMVTFIVVFYVGYCYTRYNQQFDDVQDIMHSINDACVDARVAFGDPDEVHRFWRYINLLHIASYCGLTEELSESNFFTPLVEKYGLLGEGKIRAEEEAAIKRIGLDENGSRACSMFEIWVMEVIKGEAQRARLEDPHSPSSYDLSPPIQARLHKVVSEVGVCIKRLFSYRYQVMPFIYTHLVSLSCFVYLFAEAFISGVRFKPTASVSFGLLFPLIFVLAKIISTFGLIVVGETILDPFGTDPEDFALLHFIEVTVTSSHEAIEIEASAQRHKDRQHQQFYDSEELAAAKKLVHRMVKRYRMRKLISQALGQGKKQNKERLIAEGMKMAPLAATTSDDGTFSQSPVSVLEEPLEARHDESKLTALGSIPVGKGVNSSRARPAKLVEVDMPSRDPAALISIAGGSIRQKQRSPNSRPGSRQGTRAKKNVLRPGSSLGPQRGEHPGRSYGAVNPATSTALPTVPQTTLTADELATMPARDSSTCTSNVIPCVVGDEGRGESPTS